MTSQESRIQGAAADSNPELGVRSYLQDGRPYFPSDFSPRDIEIFPSLEKEDDLARKTAVAVFRKALTISALRRPRDVTHDGYLFQVDFLVHLAISLAEIISHSTRDNFLMRIGENEATVAGGLAVLASRCQRLSSRRLFRIQV